MKNGKFVILCVDDDQDILESLKLVLEANGYVMVGASSVADAKAQYRESHPDLVIVDLMMETIDSGVSFVNELKAQGNQAPVYMLSTVGDELNRNVDAAELGLTGVFQKPINPPLLLDVLRTRLRG